MKVYILADRSLDNFTDKVTTALEEGLIYESRTRAEDANLLFDDLRIRAKDDFKNGDKSPDTAFYAHWDGYSIEELDLSIDDKEETPTTYIIADFGTSIRAVDAFGKAIANGWIFSNRDDVTATIFDMTDRNIEDFAIFKYDIDPGDYYAVRRAFIKDYNKEQRHRRTDKCL